MKQAITTLTLLLLFFFNLHSATPQQQNEIEKDLRYLFKINGTEATYKKSIKTMFAYFKSMESDAPKAYWEKAEQEFLKTSAEEYTEMMLPIYKKYLTPEDVKAYILFFESPAGQHIAKQTPDITTESMQVGMLWGRTIGEKIAADIKSNGYKLRLPFGQ